MLDASILGVPPVGRDPACRHGTYNGGGTLSVCAVGQISLHDRPQYERYVSRFMPVLEKYGGRLLAADERPEVIFGSWPYQKLILLEFKDRESVVRWESSDDYREIAKDRIAATEGTILIVRGVDAVRS